MLLHYRAVIHGLQRCNPFQAAEAASSLWPSPMRRPSDARPASSFGMNCAAPGDTSSSLIVVRRPCYGLPQALALDCRDSPLAADREATRQTRVAAPGMLH